MWQLSDKQNRSRFKIKQSVLKSEQPLSQNLDNTAKSRTERDFAVLSRLCDNGCSDFNADCFLLKRKRFCLSDNCHIFRFAIGYPLDLNLRKRRENTELLDLNLNTFQKP